MNKPIPDQAARTAALDVARSFIVQAPAGSGKTELLIQRYLALLATVQAPEEIAAITFTRKAAAEMAQRVLEALALAGEPEPDEAHRRATWKLARAAAARDAELGWHVLDNPARLRMQTIDSLCASLTRQMPLIARFGAQPGITEEAGALHLEAARNTLALLESQDAAAEDVAALLAHLDNNLPQATDLLAAMLARRDQWLRHLKRADNREHLEGALANIRREGMEVAHALLPDGIEELFEIGVYAATNLAAAGAESPVLVFADCDSPPGTDESDMPLWLALAELLLTREGTWRKLKGLNKNHGFPPDGDKTMKARLAACIESMADNEALRIALANIRTLPPCEYSQAQWEALNAIARLLPRATAELWNVFAAHGECDFVEVAQAASRALGDADAPTDLALALDYRIRHLLIDEFQDTSFTQYELLEKLTAGWQPADGRTLFLVGDPMQSIYRFREAEVGLFLKARQTGVGGIALDALTLSVNFRSQAGIVDWVNNTFARCMPQHEDIALGAVPHVHADAHHAAKPGDAVQMHALFADQPESEAEKVVALIRAAQAEKPDGSIAILVRSRPVLAEIVPALKAAGLVFRAVDIDPLAARPVVRDLLALTRAITHLADRIAWLALLRAPWCGLALADLHALAAQDTRQHERTVWEALHAASLSLSPDAALRVSRFRELMTPVMQDVRRGGLRQRVQHAWLALGGPATVESAAALDDAAIYLDHLSAHERAGTLPDLAAFESTLARLFAAPDPDADARLAIMTLHKAKGLEFDTVIIPGLARRAPSADKQLMTWVERARSEGGSDDESELLLAPVAEAGSRGDAIQQAIRAIAEQREAYERTRLMYVGATRARTRLHLLATLSRKAGEDGPTLASSPASSLLAALWPALGEDIESAHATTPFEQANITTDAAARPPLLRLASRWTPPAAPSDVVSSAPSVDAVSQAPEAVRFDWASPIARHVGTVTHRYLQHIAQQGLDTWGSTRIAGARAGIERALRQLGVADDGLQGAADRVVAALTRTLADERGRWLLTDRADAASELRLTGLIDSQAVDAIIDRTLIDENGERWIVDFKTGGHEGAGTEAFLDREAKRYAAQLRRYAALYPGEPVRLALYFPLLSAWREIGLQDPRP